LIVVDASALLDVLLGTEWAHEIERHIFTGRPQLHAPHLIDLEITQVLRRFCRRGEFSETRAKVALDDLADLSLERHRHDPYLARIWSLRENLSAYDAAYVALAETLGATLVTRDRRLASAAPPGLSVQVVP